MKRAPLETGRYGTTKGFRRRIAALRCTLTMLAAIDREAASAALAALAALDRRER